jgi:hypothetical protein
MILQEIRDINFKMPLETKDRWGSILAHYEEEGEYCSKVIELLSETMEAAYASGTEDMKEAIMQKIRGIA